MIGRFGGKIVLGNNTSTLFSRIKSNSDKCSRCLNTTCSNLQWSGAERSGSTVDDNEHINTSILEIRRQG